MGNYLRKRICFNYDWLFLHGDHPEYSKPELDDRQWRRLDVPHDWSIEHPVDENHQSGRGGGYVLTGIGWYRKHFSYTEEMKDKQVSLMFDGIYMDSSVYLNGKLIGGCGYGYTSFSVDMTEHLQEGDNVIAVRVNNSLQPNSRWYSGSGIYRNVWLIYMKGSF